MGSNYEPISLYKLYGGPLGSYQNSILRPLDTVSVPIDIKRGTFGPNDPAEDVACKWPNYAGSKFQQWCSEENAMKYYAMRPILNPDNYYDLLNKLFDTIVLQSNNSIRKSPIFPNEDAWNVVYCTESKKDIMSFIMERVTKSVSLIPEMYKNGSWVIEQFHWTDAEVYMLVSSGKLYYRVLFNLYNPLRSISTRTECVVATHLDSRMKPIIIYMGLVSAEKSQDNDPVGYNLNSQDEGISLTDNYPTDLTWNYGNTLVSQTFNKYGFYDPEETVELSEKEYLPGSLSKRIRQFEETAPEYLLPAGTVKLTPGGRPVTESSSNNNIYQSYMNNEHKVTTNEIGKVYYTV
jgi:hypothetical protein